MIKNLTAPFLTVLLVISFIWLRSAYGKLLDDKFVENLPQTLDKFVSKNPYPFVNNFLTHMAIPNSFVFANLTRFGELYAGLSIGLCSAWVLFKGKSLRILEVLMLLGLIVGAFLNLNFWFSAGWTSPSTDGLNLLMGAIQIIGAIFVLKSILKKA